LLPFSPEPSVPSPAVYEVKNYNTQNYNFACGSKYNYKDDLKDHEIGRVGSTYRGEKEFI
jgi:hypothetical protein